MRTALVCIWLLVSVVGNVHAQPAPARWTIMHYTAVDNNLEGAAFNDYYEMQSAGSDAEINIVAQLDRAVGFDNRFGDWTDTRRFHIEHVPPQPEPDMAGMREAVVQFLVAQGRGDAATLSPQAAQTSDDIIRGIYENNNLGVSFDQTPVQDLGEVDMGDPQSLVDFIEWSVDNYPADHYMLIIGSHGGGWRGIGPDDGGAQPSMLELPEIDAALTTARADLGLGKLDIIGFDACLMALTDVAVTLEPHADYVLFSQEVIPSNGWEYFNSITAMQQHPDWGALEVGSAFVDSYMEYYAGKGARSKVDLSLVDTSALPGLLASLQDFSTVVGGDTVDLLSALGTARNNSQAFGASLGDGGDFYSYIDLRDFMNWFSLQSSITADAYNAAQAVIAAYDSTVAYARADSRLPRATGLAVYLPASATTYDATYPTLAPSGMVFWENYLDEFYKTIVRELDGSALQLDIKSIFTLGDVGSTVDTPVVFFDAGGKGVVDLSYIIAYIQPDGTSAIVDAAPISYTTTLPTGETISEYPNELTPSTFNWGVELPYVGDGTNSVIGVPMSSSNSSNELNVTGTYVTPQGSQPAVLIFDKETRAYVGMLASDGTSAYQPVPNPGDQFVVDLITVSATGEATSQPQSDYPLTFGLQPFTLHYEPAFSGDYSVGLKITDLAGNNVYKRTEITVNNDAVDGSVRGYTDTNEGIHFEYPFAWGESYSFTNEDSSITNAVSDEAGAQAVYVDAQLNTTPDAALDTLLSTIDGDVSEVSETEFGGLPAYTASYTIPTDTGTATSVVFAVANEAADSVVLFTFTGSGQDVAPDPAVIDHVSSTLSLFAPVN